MGKVFTTKVYLVPGASRPFYHERDAKGYCEDKGINKKNIEKFDSTQEYRRYLTLVEMERKGEISNLQRQVEFLLVPNQTERRKAGKKQVKQYVLDVVTKGNGADDMVTFSTKKEAVDFCKLNGLKQNIIKTVTKEVEVYKDVVLEKKMVYTADFVYFKNGQKVVEDVKSEYTRKEKDYIQRRKLMLYFHKIKILETK